MTEPMTKDERDSLIARHDEVFEAYADGVDEDALSPEEEDRLREEFRALRDRYFSRLPRVALSRCPVCERLFRHSFDPWGVDGFWWHEKAARDTAEPEPCEHFGVLQGAVHLNGRPPMGHELYEASLGPGVPFVIPRVMEPRPVVAVVSTVPMANGYTAFPIVYFSAEPLPPGSFTQRWTRSSYSWPDGRGGFAWRVDTDPWDFDLEPWVERGKLLWIEERDEEMRLRSRDDGPCPYVGLEGRRERQYVTGDQLRTIPPPEGEGIDPFSG